MQRPPAVTRQDVRWLVALLLIFLLTAAAVNVPVATTFIIHRSRSLGASVMFNGAEAEAHGWPARTPHAKPWPLPNYWSAGQRFGTAYYHVSYAESAAASAGFSMQAEYYGWPIATLERVQYWWPSGDPSFPAIEPDPPIHIYWPGLILNPLIVGGGAYLLLVVPVAAFYLGQRIARRHANQCIHCGYPLGSWDYCTECGRPVPRAPAPDPAAAPNAAASSPRPESAAS
jgi:hypothetical protein